jgi:hypothetical protein
VARWLWVIRENTLSESDEEVSMMDLHEFSGGEMYFDEHLQEGVTELLEEAAESYGDEMSETLLLKALELAPESLTVHVALYRFYYYQHRHKDALSIALESMRHAALRLGFDIGWQKLTMNILGEGVMTSMTLVRFYLLALKGAGYLHLRMGDLDEGTAMLSQVASLDPHDRLGCSALLAVVERYRRRLDANFGQLTLVASGQAVR